MKESIELRIYWRGFPLFCTPREFVAVWIRLSGSLQHRFGFNVGDDNLGRGPVLSDSCNTYRSAREYRPTVKRLANGCHPVREGCDSWRSNVSGSEGRSPVAKTHYRTNAAKHDITGNEASDAHLLVS